MIKRILERFRRDRGLHKATVKIDFYPQDEVTPHIFWHRSQDPENDTIPLVVFSYARILVRTGGTERGAGGPGIDRLSRTGVQAGAQPMPARPGGLACLWGNCAW